MIDRLRQQHFNAATLCKHVERRIVKRDPKGDTALQKYTVLILSASLLNPSSYFCYVMESAMNAFTLAQSSFTQQSKLKIGGMRYKQKKSFLLVCQ